ncbi:TrmO family methyltransferase domain-containing protein [Roseibium sp. SCP14]|uniref:TrmO family methyltransferase domain-containing protein n=1 Tax=Roseibium sp. SCP14 TaxID=3141375 RepID=UPI00333B350E
MNTSLTVIGSVRPSPRGFELSIGEPYCTGLLGLCGFSHAIVLWLADRLDQNGPDISMILPAPYSASDQDTGVFATRSPARPNPIGVSIVEIIELNEAAGTLVVPFIDALPGTPLLDIKPYFPASDRVKNAKTPDHFHHWPQWYEDAGAFNWTAEFR